MLEREKKIERSSPAICIPSNRLTGDTLYYIMHTDIDLMRLFMIETVHGERPSLVLAMQVRT